jgi:hypothetical protein
MPRPLFSRERTSVPTEQKDGWAPEDPSWSFVKQKILFSLSGIAPWFLGPICRNLVLYRRHCAGSCIVVITSSDWLCAVLRRTVQAELQLLLTASALSVTVVSFTPRPLYLRYPFSTRLDGLQSQPRRFGDKSVTLARNQTVIYWSCGP